MRGGTSFHKFQLLPVEIRCRIWEFALWNQATLRRVVDADGDESMVGGCPVRLGKTGRLQPDQSSLFHIARDTHVEVKSILLNVAKFNFWSPTKLRDFINLYKRYLSRRRAFSVFLHVMAPAERDGWGEELRAFRACDVHCQGRGISDLFDEWFRECSRLPPKVHIVLRFQFIWRDFEKLSALAKKHDMASRTLHFEFGHYRLPTGPDDVRGRDDFLADSTRRAVLGQELAELENLKLFSSLKIRGTTGLRITEKKDMCSRSSTGVAVRTHRVGNGGQEPDPVTRMYKILQNAEEQWSGEFGNWDAFP